MHDLKSLVLSFHSLIAIETVEEERVRSLIHEVAVDLNLPMFEWSLTDGFHRFAGAAIGETRDPLAVLRHIESIAANDAIYLLKDMAPHLTNPSMARPLRDLAQRLMATRSAVVLTGDPIELPKDIDAVAVRFTLELPDPEELRDLVRAVIDAVGARQRVTVELTRDDAQQLVHALSGLTLNQARQVIAQAVVSAGRQTLTTDH